MPLWIDKYRPRDIQTLDINKDQQNTLQTMLENSKCNIPHLLMYGPSGSGKKTRVMAILREIYGNAVDKIKMEKLTFTLPSSKKIEVDAIASNYHLEVNPSDAKTADRHVVQELIKHQANLPSVSTNKSKDQGVRFKVIIIAEADRLSKDAQHALRRTMEKYMKNCRVVLMTKSTSRIIEPLRSRCLPIKCRAASNQELREIVYPPVAEGEYLNISDATLDSIISYSNRDMRKFLLLLEVYKVQSDAGMKNIDIKKLLPDWELYCEKLVVSIQKVTSIQQIQGIRNKLYELLIHLIPTEVIFRQLVEGLTNDSSTVLRNGIIEAAAKYEHRARQGSKPIYHLEAFVVEFLNVRNRDVNTNII